MSPDFRARHAARQSAKAAADLCGIDTPQLVWKPLAGRTGEIRGSQSGKIYLDPGISPGKALLTAAHETRHLWQIQVGQVSPLAGVKGPGEEQAEQDAREFERRALRELNARHGSRPWFQGAVKRCDEIDATTL